MPHRLTKFVFASAELKKKHGGGVNDNQQSSTNVQTAASGGMASANEAGSNSLRSTPEALPRLQVAPKAM